MDGSIEPQYTTSPVNLHWFYSKSKVPICLAIYELAPLLRRLTEAAILNEEESLELQGDTRAVHRVIYECLCCIEDKKISLRLFFDNLFCKPFLLKYPNLKPVFKEYKREKFRNGINFPADKENRDKDLIIFTQEKVKISLAITSLFPFLHGFQDLAILSESESLKLHADGRPVSQVIYECLSLIERKNLKLNIVFEYIFQECYQNLYPGLRLILEESSMEQPGPFNGMQCLTFNDQDKLLELYEQIKPDISAAITERFPFLHGLRDIGLLSRLEFLRFQAQKEKNKDVMYNALSLIHRQSDIEVLLSYVFREHYLAYYPHLKTILKKINKALESDLNFPSSDVNDVMMDQVRSCRMKPICYTELSERDWEFIQDKRRADSPPTSSSGKRTPPPQHEKMRYKRLKRHSPENSPSVSAVKQKCIRAASKLVVRLEFPKQVFEDKFPVWCGHKKGIFMKKYWTGEPRHDTCIKSDNKMFTVIEFEKYGGRASSKCWKNSLRCADRITMHTLFQSHVLKSPCNLRGKLSI